MFNIFLAVFFAELTLAFGPSWNRSSSLDISFPLRSSRPLPGRFSWPTRAAHRDNAKKIVETELKQKGTALHDATVVGDTVGDPFKDTSSVALNPIIKFTTLFGLLAVELAVSLSDQQGTTLGRTLSAIFLLIAIYFIWRSFYRMRIEREG